MKKRSRDALGPLLVVSGLALAASGCGGSGGPPTPVQTIAPLCSTIAGANPRELFPYGVLPTSAVTEALIFGGMDPGTLEPINFELGFRVNALNVPVTAPATLYVRSLETTEYMGGWRDGETDYAISFHVCSDDSSGEALPAVEGAFAHMTSLSESLAEVLASAELECSMNVGPEESVRSCRVFFPADADEGLIIPGGTLVGAAGGTGDTAYAPGFDFNLLDTRFPNEYANPERLGSEEGPGRWYRYGACVYEYFAEPERSAYMARVGQNGDLRVHESDPCGTLSIDEAGTAAGIWMRADQAALSIEDDVFEVLRHLLVLGPHPVFPNTHEVVSTELIDLANNGDAGLLVEFEPSGVSEDVNVSFYDMVPGTIYCVSAAGFGNPLPHHYYFELRDAGATLTVERLDASCAETPESERSFTNAAQDFVR